jgi:hypothetical protein
LPGEDFFFFLRPNLANQFPPYFQLTIAPSKKTKQLLWGVGEEQPKNLPSGICLKPRARAGGCISLAEHCLAGINPWVQYLALGRRGIKTQSYKNYSETPRRQLSRN